ncbi:MAG: sigma-54 dependent transcriptional regulator [Desulfobacterales bacterium]|nr:sigma-54 dependent transcriptional regulator [Desulfobacterales bacterium]
MDKVLIIDDDEQICRFLCQSFQGMAVDADYRLSLSEGIARISKSSPSVLFLDVNLPDGNGIDAIRTIRQFPDPPEIIIITGSEDPDGAETAMHNKAWDYIPKRGSIANFKAALNRALEYRRQTHAAPVPGLIRKNIIGDSRRLTHCIHQAAKASASDLPVIITGETGTGKEVFSKAIHDSSPRASGDFVVVDCAALPDHLVESTLFGHIKGAFTGADNTKLGLMALADRGTLFLDEVGELPLGVQMKFLRALQEKKFRPVGSKTEIRSDFRLICATHRDLPGMVAQKKFREDLYFRLFSAEIQLPPLKDRDDDISLLARHHLSRKARLTGAPAWKISPELTEELSLYAWPGNIRELINTLDLVCSDAGQGTTLFPHHLPPHIRAFNIREKLGTGTSAAAPSRVAAGETAAPLSTFKAHMDKSKKAYLVSLLAMTDGNIQAACKCSGLSRAHLYRLLQQYELK